MADNARQDLWIVARKGWAVNVIEIRVQKKTCYVDFLGSLPL